MTTFSDSVRKFNLYAKPRTISTTEVANGLQMSRPVSLNDMVRRLNSLSAELRLSETITTGTALGGRAEMVLRSDGTYTFNGHMRATGLPSFAFHVSATVQSATGRALPTAACQGRVFGTDTPGDRQKNWSEGGHNENIRQNWLSLAQNASLAVRKEYNVAGVLGTLADVAVALAEFIAITARTQGGGLALAIVLGSHLGEAGKEPWPFPKLPLGVTVAGGVVLIFGPGAVVPAIVMGAAAEAIIDHRPMSEEEAIFARRVFGNNTLPAPDQIILTNALGLDNRKFVMPGVGGTYFVNLGDAAFKNPMSYRTLGADSTYPQPGQLFIHELTHVWQAKRLPAMTYFCEGATSTNYNPDGDPRKPWSAYGMEQQAAIVDSWYAADPAFSQADPLKAQQVRANFEHYVNGNIRAGLL